MVEIVEVKTRGQMRKFVEFPNKLYKGNNYYCPPMAQDEWDTFNPKKNPSYEFCESKQFLAYKDKKLVGRITGIINHIHCDRTGKKQIRFNRFDAIDDIEVSKALFQAVIDYGKEKGMDEIIGPIGFYDLDREGMLIEGFEEQNLQFTIYNAPYYITHMEQMGFVKDADWVEFQIKLPKELDPRVDKIANRVMQRYGYHIIPFSADKKFRPYGEQALTVINEAFDKLYGYIPLTPALKNKVLDQYFKLIDPEYCIVVGDKNDNVIGFGVMIPSITQACRKTNGHMFPFGFIQYLKALNKKKNHVLDMYLIGVKPEYQSTGVNAIIMNEMLKTCIKYKAEIAETGPELELNDKIQDQWKGYDARQHRRRRSWIAKFDDLKLK